MAELISRCFEALIFEVNALPIPREYKDAMIGKLDFLRTQSLCDFDRRKPTAQLREAWKEVDRDMATHGLYDRYKPSRRVWDTIGMFVEVGQFKPIAAKSAATDAATDAIKSKYHEASIIEIFELMRKDSSGVPSIKAKLKLKAGLTFLIDEATKPLALRNHDVIVATWRDIHAELKIRSILKPFESEPMKTRVLDFLKGDRDEKSSSKRAASIRGEL
jgi:hypothetical protein